METQPIRAAKDCFTREEWLARALATLARQGRAKIQIENLCQELGVTKGSFYWHFQDRRDFVRSLVEFWADTTTQLVVDEISRIEGGPEERLLALMKMLAQEKLARYDVAVRAWAAQEPVVAEIVQKVDEQRITFVGALFRKMGFQGRELEMRTHIFVCFHSMELALLVDQSEQKRSELVNFRHQFFIRA